MRFIDVLLGRPLATTEGRTRKIGLPSGIAAMGLDGLSSAAYGPEAMLAILAPLGLAGLAEVGWLTGVILLLLAMLYASYCQTLAAYPTGGGSYTVAKENLGTYAGLLAAAALMIDYVLNTAVGISAGVAAMVSALPALHRYTLPLCLAVLAVITLINLRGTREAGIVFALPTYLFLASLGGVIALGTAKTLLAGDPRPVVPPPPLGPATETVGIWLLLRAFASGCTAMTGVEAVSNGITAFREPKVVEARRTLTAIVALLGLLLAGIAYLVGAYRIAAMAQDQSGYQSVLSQLAGAVIGHGVPYYVTMAAILAVLCLSANTSFTGFPRLCRRLAEEGFLPHPFAIPGRRLAYSIGILYLASAAGLLLLVFDGVTNQLIPLFAVGAFLAFTLSQLGMAVHWQRAGRDAAAPVPRRQAAGQRVRLAINALGATATGGALVVIVAGKFLEGAWITVLAIPLTLLLLRSIKRYYERIATSLRAERIATSLRAERIVVERREPPIVLIPIESWNRSTDRALEFAIRLSDDVVALHLIALEGADPAAESRALRRKWKRAVRQPAEAAGIKPPALVQLRSPYRRLLEPLFDYIRATEETYPERVIAVVIPELVKQRWWQHFLHAYRGRRLRRALMYRAGQRLVIVNLPWRLDQPPRTDKPEDET